jgi:hypothetical protein
MKRLNLPASRSDRMTQSTQDPVANSPRPSSREGRLSAGGRNSGNFCWNALFQPATVFIKQQPAQIPSSSGTPSHRTTYDA